MDKEIIALGFEQDSESEIYVNYQNKIVITNEAISDFDIDTIKKNINKCHTGTISFISLFDFMPGAIEKIMLLHGFHGEVEIIKLT